MPSATGCGVSGCAGLERELPSPQTPPHLPMATRTGPSLTSLPFLPACAGRTQVDANGDGAAGDGLAERDPSMSASMRHGSGFNIFVDDLGQKVREIHAETRVQLPSIDNGEGSDDADDD